MLGSIAAGRVIPFPNEIPYVGSTKPLVCV
jgi:hypothetical protein